MRHSDKPIDYLDLYISLTEASEAKFEQFLEDFSESHIYIEISPRIKNEVLMINSTDLIAFTGYIDTTQLSEIELFRFKTKAKEQLEQQLVKSLAVSNQAHYKWCLTQLNSLEFGRYLRPE